MPRLAKSWRNRSASSRHDGPTKPEKSLLVVPSGLTVTFTSRIAHPTNHDLTMFTVQRLCRISKCLQRLHRCQTDIGLEELLLDLLIRCYHAPGVTHKRQFSSGLIDRDPHAAPEFRDVYGKRGMVTFAVIIEVERLKSSSVLLREQGCSLM